MFVKERIDEIIDLYKNQAEKFCDDFSDLNLKMNVVDNVKLLIEDSDVVVSAITETTELICEDNSVYGEGVLLVPIHTRGFQNCDLFFDKIFADDTDHVKGFKYFSKFQNFALLLNSYELFYPYKIEYFQIPYLLHKQ